MKNTPLLCVLVLLIGGCAMTFTHPTKSGGDFERDRKECEAIAKKTLAAKGSVDDCGCDAVVGKEIIRCLGKKGWTRSR